jgi:hypothetical protein
MFLDPCRGQQTDVGVRSILLRCGSARSAAIRPGLMDFVLPQHAVNATA